MATFNVDSINSINENSDMKKVKSYIFQLNDQLEYMFSNLTPEDNYSSKAFAQYKTDGERITEISASVDGIKLTMITKNNIVAAINLSAEGVKIKGNKISLEGTVTANNNFVIRPDGTMEAKAGVFQGSITASTVKGGLVEGNTLQGNTIKAGTIEGTNIKGVTVEASTFRGNTLEGNVIKAGTINGSTINGGVINGEMEINCGPRFWVREIGDNHGYNVGFGAFEVRYDGNGNGDVLASHDSGIVLSHETNNITCNDIYLTDGYMKGWGLVRTIKDIYNILDTKADA